MSGMLALFSFLCVLGDEYGWAAFLMWLAWMNA